MGKNLNCKPCVGFPSYIVSDTGRIFRVKMRGTVFPEPREMKQNKSKQGYMRSVLCENGIRYNVFPHKIMLEAFRPKPDGEYESSHLDGNRSNNVLSNLIWETRSENHARKILHGTRQSGERCGKSLLMNIDVERIRYYISMGIKQAVLSRYYGVSEQCISNIKKGKTYVYV